MHSVVAIRMFAGNLAMFNFLIRRQTTIIALLPSAWPARIKPSAFPLFALMPVTGNRLSDKPTRFWLIGTLGYAQEFRSARGGSASRMIPIPCLFPLHALLPEQVSGSGVGK